MDSVIVEAISEIKEGRNSEAGTVPSIRGMLEEIVELSKQGLRSEFVLHDITSDVEWSDEGNPYPEITAVFRRPLDETDKIVAKGTRLKNLNQIHRLASTENLQVVLFDTPEEKESQSVFGSLHSAKFANTLVKHVLTHGKPVEKGTYLLWLENSHDKVAPPVSFYFDGEHWFNSELDCTTVLNQEDLNFTTWCGPLPHRILS